MTPTRSLDSGVVWFAVFLVVTGLLAVYTGSLVEGSVSALILVGLAFVAYNLFSE